MELSGMWTLLMLVAIAHFFLAMLATSEVANYPLFNLKQKVIFQLILWLIPIAGTLFIHKKLGIGWGGGSGSGGDGTHGATVVVGLMAEAQVVINKHIKSH